MGLESMPKADGLF